MIDAEHDPVGWALMVAHLEEARDHLDSLIASLAQTRSVDEAEFAVDIGHLYAHINRVWNSRRSGLENVSGEQWDAFTEFPSDVRPVG